jgi:hypothetical protein
VFFGWRRFFLIHAGIAALPFFFPQIELLDLSRAGLGQF